MKRPSQNVTRSLSSQSPAGRGQDRPEIAGLRPYGPSMVAPGTGEVRKAPGTGTRSDGRQERSASHYADAMGRRVGG